MKDQELILGLLARVARRLWLNRCLHQLGFVVSLALLALLAYWLVKPAFSALPFGPVPMLAGGAVLILCVLYALRGALKRFTLAQAAGAVDTQAQLNDELKTAYWLATRDAETPFAALQIARAARTSSGIDPARVVPTRVPRSAWGALLLGVLMILTTLWEPPSAHSWYGPHSPSAASPDARALLEGTRDQSARELAEALGVLEDETASLQAREQALARARQAQDEIDLRAAAARETLARLAGAMAGREETRQAGDALAQGRTAEAVEMLQQLAGETPREGAGSERQTNVGQTDVKVNQEALQQVLKDIQDAQSAVDTQSRTAQVRRRMENFLVAAIQGRSLTAARFGSQASTPAATPAPETGNADLQGGSMFRQGAVARSEDPSESQDGSKTGAASGDAEALPVEGLRTERLEAKLKREHVAAAADGAENDSEQWMYKPSQGSNAQTSFAEVRGLERFAEAGAPEREQIPLGQRQAVRDYFLNLHQSEQQREP